MNKRKSIRVHGDNREYRFHRMYAIYFFFISIINSFMVGLTFKFNMIIFLFFLFFTICSYVTFIKVCKRALASFQRDYYV
jgi:hypothetical protein